MSESFGPLDQNPEYPDYSAPTGDGGTDRFAPPGAQTSSRGWRNRNSRKVETPTQAPSVSPAPPMNASSTPAPPYAAPEQRAVAPGQPIPPPDLYGMPPANPYAAPGGPGFPPPRKSNGVRNVVIGVIVAIAVLAIIGVLASIFSDSDPIDPNSPSPISSPNASPSPGGTSSSPSPNVSPAPADPVSFDDAIVEFDEFTVRGNGDETFDLPDGVTNGVVEIVYNGSRYFDLTSLDASGNYYEGIFWTYTSSSPVRVTTIFGGYRYGDEIPTQMDVDAYGDWQITFRPLSTLEPLPDTYEQDGEAPVAFYYEGPGENVEIVFEVESDSYAYFRVKQEVLLDYTPDVISLNRSATVETSLDPGPSIIVIDPSGAASWSITRK